MVTLDRGNNINASSQSMKLTAILLTSLFFLSHAAENGLRDLKNGGRDLQALDCADPLDTFDLEIGDACPDFGIRVQGYYSNLQGPFSTKTKKNGFLIAGPGVGCNKIISSLNINGEVIKEVTVKGRSGNIKDVTSDDGVFETVNGLLLLILFPNDTGAGVIPDGPSITLFNGHAELFISVPDFVFEFTSAKGNAVDICAALA
jgi:hypothetical protein